MTEQLDHYRTFGKYTIHAYPCETSGHGWHVRHWTEDDPEPSDFAQEVERGFGEMGVEAIPRMFASADQAIEADIAWLRSHQ